ncbi:hypothetical protein E2562_026983 [Oryza meyeriana var. granulata]|uniref:BHLH domain-containing protein n=1 Tax=Oryza meyeriana var. granulata TaxID=110450 RepID=A0A6G1EPL8_9ORYZ|nr:hypothetical protein E2562_026983 [Oryza meyeriana var. granulata]
MEMATCQKALQEGKQQHLHHGGYDLSSVYRGTVVLPWQGSLAPEPPPPPSSSSGRSATDQATALRIHSEAERRRRERINAHLATLRRILPDAKQMDKATLLASVVNQVKHLKTRATEATTHAAPIPPEANEVTVQWYAGEHTYVRATVSCDDRPGLLAGIAGAFRRLRLRPLRADMSCLGGRTQHAFVLCREEQEAAAAGDVNASAASVRSLKEAVRQALAKVAFPEMVYGSGGSRRKRQRLLESRYATVVCPHGW